MKHKGKVMEMILCRQYTNISLYNDCVCVYIVQAAIDTAYKGLDLDHIVASVPSTFSRSVSFRNKHSLHAMFIQHIVPEMVY